jgi:hypothetical protein
MTMIGIEHVGYFSWRFRLLNAIFAPVLAAIMVWSTYVFHKSSHDPAFAASALSQPVTIFAVFLWFAVGVLESVLNALDMRIVPGVKSMTISFILFMYGLGSLVKPGVGHFVYAMVLLALATVGLTYDILGNGKKVVR